MPCDLCPVSMIPIFLLSLNTPESLRQKDINKFIKIYFTCINFSPQWILIAKDD